MPRRGFTLVEILVALLLLAVTVAGIVALFGSALRLSRAQSSAADLQQSLRTAQREVLRAVRIAGRGGPARGPLPVGLALAVHNAAPASGPGSRIAITDPSTPRVAPGSDVLVVRGVLSSPLFQVEPSGSASRFEGEPPAAGSVTVRDPSPTGIPQDLGPLADAIDGGRPEALLLVSPLGPHLYAVVELSGGGREDDGSLTLRFRARDGLHTSAYLALSPAGVFPPELHTVWQVGILEEHRYYVRAYDDPGEGPGGVLTRARFYPGTDAPYAGSAANLSVAIADRILDLQVALGIDTDADGTVEESEPPDGSDEWLYNSSQDTAGAPGWSRRADGRPTRLLYVRLSTAGRGTRRETNYLAPPFDRLEDRPAESAVPGSEESVESRSYRRWILTTLAEPRNLS
jgi:prepilin-type N-terminal cleavage/methylation domain-containing protein